ncbi:MAG: methyltransferase domain-containing protein [Planctomycetes bacterium]|nr:methyltransferase domain-containing protein [Planctomycetota bacterium]NOG53815.1 metalloregulator ArsR/SmtB family transcription factor [Planctomycetota bacterium]
MAKSSSGKARSQSQSTTTAVSSDRGPTTTSPSPTHKPITDRLAVLSELSRLRLLRLLEQEELAVGEMASIVQMPQSTVSRHLKVLLEGGWIVRRSEGTAARYRMVPEGLPAEWVELWQLTRTQLGETSQIQQDEHRLAQVLADRRMDTSSYFGQVGGEWDGVREDLFGHAFADEALLALIPGDAVVADLGCGTGEIASRLAAHVKHVHCVDSSKAMLDAARRRLDECTNITFHKSDLSDLALDDGSIDIAVISLVLHHVEQPEQAVAQAARCLKAGSGRLLIVDMVEHDRDQYRFQMGHVWLGFSKETVMGWLKAVGMTKLNLTRLTADASARGPELFAAVGTRM